MKKIFTIFSLLALLSLSEILNAQIPTNGLVGYWPFNGNANDESGNGNNGTVDGATLTTDRFGNANKAYSFIGISKKITVPNSTSLNFSPSQSFTINAWVKINSTQSLAGIVTKGAPDGVPISDSKGWQLLVSLDKFYTELGDGTIGCAFNDNNVMTHSQWYLMSYIVDRNTSKASYFINGILVADSVNVAYNSTDMTNTYPLYFGAERTLNSSYYFQGLIDDIRIYNRALNPAEVSLIYNEGLCYSTITVTDTLIINANLTSYNPVTFQNIIKIFPNPTNDNITINFGSNFSTLTGYTLKITNSLSQVVYTTPITQQQTIVNLSTWTGNGIYFVHLIDAQSNTIDIRKIVLQ